MIWETVQKYRAIFFISFLTLAELNEVACKQIDSTTESDEFSLSSSQVVAVCLSTLAFLFVLVVAILKCTDCYNSEVSSEFHPASQGSAPKWGGSVGYTSNNMTSGTVTFGETVNPDISQGLPYSMIPTNIPEQAGFQGYSTGNGGGGVESARPLMGYQGYGPSTPSAPSARQSGGSTHYNPAEDREPPPAYGEALRHGSLHGYSGNSR